MVITKENKKKVTETSAGTRKKPNAVLVLYNDDIHTFRQVTHTLQQATGKPYNACYSIMMKAHNAGESVVLEDKPEACLEANSVLRDGGLRTEVKL